MGVTTGARRVLTAGDITVQCDEAKPVEFVDVITLQTTEALIKERERTSGVDLSVECINAERAMEATLEKTIPRLMSELECAYGRKKEYASKRSHWEYAEQRRNNYKNSCRVDRSLKIQKVKTEVDERQAAIDKAYADKRKAEDELFKIQNRMRKADEDAQRARAF